MTKRGTRANRKRNRMRSGEERIFISIDAKTSKGERIYSSKDMMLEKSLAALLRILEMNYGVDIDSMKRRDKVE